MELAKRCIKSQLGEGAQLILDLLISLIKKGRFIPDQPETFLGYKEAHDLLGLDKRGYRWGASLNSHGLGELARWCVDHRFPAITGFVISISATHPAPSKGYFSCFGKEEDDHEWWMDQVKQAVEFDWGLYLNSAPTPADLRHLEDIVEEGTLSEYMLKSRQRCSALQLRAKQHYRDDDGLLRCVACGWHSPAKIARDIVEIHHLNPLEDASADGRRMSWDEALNRVRPLCPNCHRIAHAMDSGVYSISQLRHLN